MQVVKNVAFTRLIKAEGRVREFNFRKRTTDAAAYYHVDVSDERNTRFMFQMHFGDNRWKVNEQLLPSWIIQAEPELHNAIVSQE